MLRDQEERGCEDRGGRRDVEGVVRVPACAYYVALDVVSWLVSIGKRQEIYKKKEREKKDTHQATPIFPIGSPPLRHHSPQTLEVDLSSSAAHGSGGLGQDVRPPVPGREVQSRQQRARLHEAQPVGEDVRDGLGDLVRRYVLLGWVGPEPL